MKKIIALFFSILIFTTTKAQFSFGAPKAKKDDKQSEVIITAKALKSVTGLDTVTSTGKLNHRVLYKNINDTINKLADDYYQKRLFIISQDTIKNKKEVIAALLKNRDSLIDRQKELKRLIKYWERYDRYEEVKQSKNFFPAYYSTQAVRFFEDDTTHLKLFQNNLINYNPKTKKMTLYTEAVNDYLGPFRVGIGFQVESESKIDSLSTPDSTKNLEKKTDMLAAIQNGGGDISLNVKYPIIKSGNRASGLQYKFYFYANSGFSLPVLNKASTDFIFNYDGGIEGALYMKGFNNRLTFYTQLRAAYYNGNKNYQKVITDANKDDPASFVMFQTSFGLDFLDGYRLRVDLYNGNSFVKKNFPASVTFIVRPGK